MTVAGPAGKEGRGYPYGFRVEAGRRPERARADMKDGMKFFCGGAEFRGAAMTQLAERQNVLISPTVMDEPPA